MVIFHSYVSLPKGNWAEVGWSLRRLMIVIIYSSSMAHQSRVIVDDSYSWWLLIIFSSFSHDFLQSNCLSLGLLHWPNGTLMDLPVPFFDCHRLYILWMGQRNPNHQLVDGKHPMIYRVEKPSFWWCRISLAHPQYDQLQQAPVKTQAAF